MIVKISGRSALILAAGLFVCFACPSLAAAGAGDAAANSKSENAAGAPVALHKNLRHGAYHRKRYAHARHHRLALKSAEDKSKSAEGRKTAATNVTADSGAASSELPPSVANANAQLPSAGEPGRSATAMPAWANDATPATSDNPANAKADNGSVIIAADQLNDVDRALREGNAPAAGSVVASANPPAAPVVASGRESSTWDQTSLIGKIFIGFGALLTMASAARMFMA
jgi:hypothetical protein